MTSSLSRRAFITRSAALGCSLAASPLVTPVTFASTPGDNRLVVIILRGGMDALDLVRPVGNPDFATLRPEAGKGRDLDGYHAANTSLDPLMPLWQAGQLGFVQAISTPYRDKRSHFDGQDLLEAGTGQDSLGQNRDGWLNRLVGQIPGATHQTAYAVGRSDMLLTRGPAPVANWAPDAALTLSPQARLLLEHVMHDDPLFRDATLEAIDLSQTDLAADAPEPTAGDMMNAMADSVEAARRGDHPETIARFAAGRLRQDARIAAFSLNGWDTHRNQHRSFPNALQRLTDTIQTLQEGLGAAWERTTVVAITEFGRTARMNGSAGTDHGTAGTMLLAGGAVRGGITGRWTGLTEADLYARRDLMPTRDLRAHLGWLAHTLYGIDRAAVESVVFPGVDMGPDPRLTL